MTIQKNVRLNILADATRAKREMKDVTADADKLNDKKINPKVGLDTAPFKRDLGPLNIDMDKLGKRNIMPKISIDDDAAKAKLKSFGLDFDKFAKKRADLGVSVNDNEAKRKLIALNLEMDRIGKYVMRPEIDVIGEQRAIERILKVSAAMDKLSHETAHVRIDEDVNKKGGLFSGLSTDLSTALSGAFEDAAPIAEEGGASLMSSIGEGMGPLGATIGVAVASAMALTPGVLAAASGLGVGLAGVMIASFKINSKGKFVVIPEIAKFKKNIFGDLVKDVEPIQKALVPALAQISGFVKSESGPLKAMFAASIPSLKLFVGVMEQFAKALIPAITQALKTLKPNLPELGKAFGTLLDAVVEFIKVIGPAIKPSIIVFEEFAKIAKFALIAVGVACDVMAVAFRVAFTECKIIVEVFIDVVKSVWVILRDLFTLKFGQIAKDLGKVWGGLWRELLGELKVFWNNIKGPLDDIWHFAVKIFGDIESGVKKAWDAVWSWCKSRLRQFSSDVASIWDAIFSFAKNVFGKIESGVKKIWDSLWNWAKSRVKQFSSDVASIWDNIVSFAKNVFNKLETDVRKIWDSLWNWAKSRLKQFSSDVASIWDGIWSFAKNLFNKLERDVKGIWDDLWAWAKSRLRTFSSDVASIWDGIWSFAKSLFGKIERDVKGIWNDLWGWAKDRLRGFSSDVGNIVDGIETFMSRTFTRIENTVKGIWKRMWNDLKSAADTGVRWLQNAINAIGGFWNTVSKDLHLGLPTFKSVHFANGGMVEKDAPHFAEGGKVPGQGAGDSVHAMLTPGEAVIPRRLVSNYSNQLKSDGIPGFAMGGGVGTADRPFHYAHGTTGGTPAGAGKPSGGGNPGVQNLDGNGQPVSGDGGFWGTIAHAFSNAGHAIAKGTSDVITNLNPAGKGFVGNAIHDFKKDAIEVVFDPIRTMVGNAVKSVAGTAGLGDMVASAATTMVSDLINKLDASVTSKEADAGGSGSAIAAYAKQFVGHRYVLGGSGDYQNRHSAPFGPWDCAGFVTQMYEHFGIHPTGTVNVSGLYGWAGARMKKPTVGGMAFFPGADGTMAAPGHVGLVTGKNQMVNAEDERDGTRLASLAGAAWFAVPKGGFPGTGDASGAQGIGNVAKFLFSAGYSKAAAAGAAGVVGGEGTNANPESVGSGGAGLIGWTPPGAMRADGGTCHAAGIGNNSTAQDMINQEHAMVKWMAQNGWPAPQSRFANSVAGAMDAAYSASAAYERPLVRGSDVHRNLIQEAWNALGSVNDNANGSGGKKGPVAGPSPTTKHHLALGGWLNEPVFGQGLRTGASYALAENGPEYVTPGGNMRGRGSGGGVVYQITVQAGLNSPADVGEATVKAITKYEQRIGHRGDNAVFNK